MFSAQGETARLSVTAANWPSGDGGCLHHALFISIKNIPGRLRSLTVIDSRREQYAVNYSKKTNKKHKKE